MARAGEIPWARGVPPGKGTPMSLSLHRSQLGSWEGLGFVGKSQCSTAFAASSNLTFILWSFLQQALHPVN